MGKEGPGVEMRESRAEMEVCLLLLRLHTRTHGKRSRGKSRSWPVGAGGRTTLGEGVHGKSKGSKSSLRLPPRGGVHVPPLDSVRLWTGSGR